MVMAGRSGYSEPDIILAGGHVITLDSGMSEAEAVAVKGSRILAVGSNDAIRGLKGPNTRVIDLAGDAVIPGIIDAHAHMEREGLKALRLSLDGARSIADILDRIATAAKETPNGDWIVTMPVGDPPFYYDELETIAEGRMPNRWELDRVAPDHPVCIMAAFGNWGAPPCYWALNSRALALNGLTSKTRPAFDSTEIEKDSSTGEPTGVIIEHSARPIAPFDILKAVPKFTYDERLAGLKESMRLYNAVGTTGIYEGHGSAPETIALYRELWEQNALTVRTRLTVSPTWRAIEQAGELMRNQLAYARGKGFGDDWLTISDVFIGLMGNTALRDCSLDALPDTGWSGFVEPATNFDEFRELAHLCAQNSLRLHTIVSGRMDKVIPILEEIDAAHSLKERRWIVEHIDLVTPEQIAALKRLGVLVTSIPVSTLWQRGADWLDRPETLDHVAPLRRMMESGLTIAAGTDNIPYNPFYTLWTMMAREERTGGAVIGPDQRLTALQGLRALTIEGAYLSFEENQRGSIEPGKLADLAVLSADPTRVPLDDVRDISAALTIVDGRIVQDTRPQ
jgi:predicted amidohydrolase YtcJ